MRFWYAVSLAAVLLACSGREPRVERITASGFNPTHFSMVEARGTRDGDSTTASWIFETPDGRRLELELTLGYDPQFFLERGAWQGDGGSGSVLAQSVLFTGGQGQGVSAGGTYILLDGDEERWRVILPLTALQQPGWKP